MNLICFNGKMVDAETPILTAANRAFRYGDAVFETMKVKDGSITLKDLHFERLSQSLKLLQINTNQTEEKLEKKIISLCEKNKTTKLATVRLEVFRDNESCGYLIEAFPLDEDPAILNEQGWSICIHPFLRKACDGYANLKSANFLPYVMADIYRQEKNADECIVLNSSGNIADGSRTNIFLVKDDEVLTPALHQGCVNGVMRRHLIQQLKANGIAVKQTEITVDMLKQADAVFLTNAIRGIKWVCELENKTFVKETVEKINRNIGAL
jgi:branched-chain amino acid aminotransferase